MTHPTWSPLKGLAWFSLAASLTHCGDADSTGALEAPRLWKEPGGGAGATNTAGSGGGLPPEQETESSYRSPVATGRFVWVANPSSGRVAYVDAATLEVRTVPAGDGPTYAAPVPDAVEDVAITINTRSNDASILRLGAGTGLEAVNLPVHAEANSWAISKQGKWAIAWSDWRQVTNPSPARSFQDMTVIGMSKGAETTTRVSIGYRPVAVSFSQDESRAYAVSQDGISVIELTSTSGPVVSRLIPVSEDQPGEVSTRDVSITPDGEHALVRQDGSSAVTIVTLSDGMLTEVMLPGECTDLDLVSDGSRALAVIRDRGSVAVLPIPAIVSDPTQFEILTVEGATVGSVSVASAAPVALLYTNGTAEERVTELTWDTSAMRLQPHRLHAPVQAVLLSEQGNSAVVVHQDPKHNEPAFSALSMKPLLPAKIVATRAKVEAAAITSDGTRTVVAERDDAKKVFGAYFVRGETQQVDRYELSSPPIAAGVVQSAHRAYIAQEHPEGRITFIDIDTGLARTLTGFELAARVVDGSKP